MGSIPFWVQFHAYRSLFFFIKTVLRKTNLISKIYSDFSKFPYITLICGINVKDERKFEIFSISDLSTYMIYVFSFNGWKSATFCAASLPLISWKDR